MLKFGLEVDRQLFKHQFKVYKGSIENVKRKFYQDTILDCDSKGLFRLVNKLCSASSSSPLPECTSDKVLASKFNELMPTLT